MGKLTMIMAFCTPCTPHFSRSTNLFLYLYVGTCVQISYGKTKCTGTPRRSEVYKVYTFGYFPYKLLLRIYLWALLAVHLTSRGGVRCPNVHQRRSNFHHENLRSLQRPENIAGRLVQRMFPADGSARSVVIAQDVGSFWQRGSEYMSPAWTARRAFSKTRSHHDRRPSQPMAHRPRRIAAGLAYP